MAEATTDTKVDTKTTTAVVDTKAASTDTTTTQAATATTSAPAKGNGEDTSTTTDTKGVWPEKWLDIVSRGDEKRAKDLKKFQSPEALADGYVALQRRLGSGEYKPTLPKDPTADDLKAWRKDNGIPEKPDGYDLKGVEIPEGDKEIVNGFLTKLHSANASPDVAREAIRSYYAEQSRQVEARQAQDETQRQTALDALNQEWGGSFRRNLNMMTGLLSKFPESVREGLKSARLPDGTLLFNNVDAVRGLTALAFEINPAGIVTPAGSGDIQKGAMDEYNELRTFMREQRPSYNKDEGKQARMLELIDFLSKNELIDAQGNPVVQRKKAA